MQRLLCRWALWGTPLLLCGLVACAGGSAKFDRNPRENSFYSNEEIIALSSSARNAYCNELEEYLNELREETAAYNGRLDSMDTMADSLRTQTIQISAEIREVNAELRDLRLRRKTVTSYTVREGDSLRQIAKLLYGDPNRWRGVWEANEAAIGAQDADLVTGTVLTIPR